MAEVFFTADTHFSHHNIITYENRPFKDINHMNECLVRNWNNVVSKDDKVFLLGDVTLCAPETVEKYIRRLNGKITLVHGNHDRKSTERWINIGFDGFSRHPILYRNRFLLSHRPLHLADNNPYINIFGHVHGSPAYQTWAPKGVCVSVERHNYAPISFSEIEKYYK